ncbi:MAG: mRNA surveillance protein Pelota [Desulfurococcales archaeon]|nr:mRNA surveillance protein Pelota [Desulfurococcales archaeon]
MQVERLDNKSRRVRLKLESEEDLWVLRTLLREGDLVTAKTTRDVKISETGEAERRPMILTVEVRGVEFQPFSGSLRVKGVIVEGPDRYGLKGSWHSFNFKPGMELEVEKLGGWSKRDLERASKKTFSGKAIIAAVDYDEYAIGLVSVQGMKILEEAEIYLPGKDDPSREQSLEKELASIAGRIAEYTSRYNADTIVLVGPGFVKEMLAERVRERVPGKKVLIDDTSMGGVKGVEEALKRDKIAEALREVEAVRAEGVLEEFNKLLVKDQDLIAYTPIDVARVSRLGAVEKIVMIDELLYSPDEDVRLLVEEILDNAERYRVDVVIVPAKSPVARRLLPLGGIIAVLRYRVPRDARLSTDES